MAIGIGFSTASFVGGYLIAWTNYSAFYLISIGIVVFGTLLLWGYLYGPLPISPPAAKPEPID